MSRKFGKKLLFTKNTVATLEQSDLGKVYGGVTNKVNTQCCTDYPCDTDVQCNSNTCPVPRTRVATCANTCRFTCDDMTCYQRTCETCGGICH